MKKFTRLIAALLLVAVILAGLSGCEGDILSILSGFLPGGDDVIEITSLEIKGEEKLKMTVGETIQLEIDAPDQVLANVTWVADKDIVTVSGGTITAEATGTVRVGAIYGNLQDSVEIEILPASGSEITIDPYKNMTAEEFYANYKPATSYMDSYFRSIHGFMSGTIAEQDQKPTISAYQPKVGGKYVRNNVGIYGDGGNSYTIVDAYGNPVMTIYRGGAYIMLEEVAAHLFAFGQITANHTSAKNIKNARDMFATWGEYLRLNHTEFSGNTTKYPYEPKLPDISGCGGDLTYYELDIGTTGTDCDPKYSAVVYNNGLRIERGAARIVYTVYDKNGDKIIDINEKYLFYTYNHYNDFQEYLNYWGGWGEMFGNITGGGTISSKYHYSPTPYVKTVRMDISKMVAFIALPEWYMPVDDKKYA